MATQSNTDDIQPTRIVKNAKPIYIAGLSKVCIFGENKLDASAQWHTFGALVNKIPSQNGKYSYGICFDINDGKGIEYVCGVQVPQDTETSDLPDELDLKCLSSFNYAVFDHEGHVSQIRKTCNSILQNWIPQSGYRKPHNANFFFERYGENFDPQKGRGEIEIWIPVVR